MKRSFPSLNLLLDNRAVTIDYDYRLYETVSSRSFAETLLLRTHVKHKTLSSADTDIV